MQHAGDELYQTIAEVFELFGVHIAGHGAVLCAAVSKDAPDAKHKALSVRIETKALMSSWLGGPKNVLPLRHMRCLVRTNQSEYTDRPDQFSGLVVVSRIEMARPFRDQANRGAVGTPKQELRQLDIGKMQQGLRGACQLKSCLRLFKGLGKARDIDNVQTDADAGGVGISNLHRRARDAHQGAALLQVRVI